MVIAENKIFAALKELGVDIEGTLSRFVDDDEIYTRFLTRFPDEDRMTPINDAIKAGDNEALLKAAHKMKGVTANLGMTELSARAEKIVSKLRNDISEGFEEDARAVAEEYDRICGAIIDNRSR